MWDHATSHGQHHFLDLGPDLFKNGESELSTDMHVLIPFPLSWSAYVM